MALPDTSVSADRSNTTASSSRLRPWATALATTWFIVASWLLFTSDPGSGLGDYSTLGHFLLFGALGAANVAVALTFASDALSEMRAVWIAAIATAAIAILTEVIQHVLPARRFETADLTSDISGIATATILCLVLLVVIQRSVLVKGLVGAGVVGLALLGAAAAVLASQTPSAVDGLCEPATKPENTPTEKSAALRVRLTAPDKTSGCVRFGDGWLAPLLGSAVWDEGQDAVRFELGGLQSAPQPELAQAIQASGEFTVGLRLRPTNIFDGRVTRWVFEVVDPSRPGRPLVRVLQTGSQVRSDATGGNNPGDIAMLAVAGVLPEDEWAEVVVIVDVSSHEMFVNGELQGSLRRATSELATEDNLVVVLGVRERSPEFQFLGQISDVIVLPEAIDPNDINGLFDEP